MSTQVWSRRWGYYNISLYGAGERAEAMHGSPIFTCPCAVAWYPGKPLVCILGCISLETATGILDTADIVGGQDVKAVVVSIV